MQAKMEPGNPSPVQLTPTVQATRSNYTQVHEGARPPYVEYFLDANRATRLVDQLQFEQGSAFLAKRNRNMVVFATEDVPVLDDFRWLTMGQVKQLLCIPNLVSMDARTVLSCIPLAGGADDADEVELSLATSAFGMALIESLRARRQAAHSSDDVLGWLTEARCSSTLRVDRIPLRAVAGWSQHPSAIANDRGRYFSVVGVRVEATNREVTRWDQPLIAGVEKGLVAFLVKRLNGVLHFLVQAKVEPGNADTVSLGPTVQCVLGAECVSDPASWPPFMDLVVDATPEAVRYSCTQAEEGGRFYHVENEYRVVELPESDQLLPPEGYLWVTLGQLTDFLRHGQVNIEARNLLACLSLT
jgi:oxidase EvaA